MSGKDAVILKDVLDWDHPERPAHAVMTGDGYVSLRLTTGDSINLPSGVHSHSVAAAINSLGSLRVAV